MIKDRQEDPGIYVPRCACGDVHFPALSEHTHSWSAACPEYDWFVQAEAPEHVCIMMANAGALAKC